MSAVALPNQPAPPRPPWGRWSIQAVVWTYLSVLLVVPLLALLQDGLRAGVGELWRQLTLPIAWHALKLTLWTSAVMTVINGVGRIVEAVCRSGLEMSRPPSQTGLASGSKAGRQGNVCFRQVGSSGLLGRWLITSFCPHRAGALTLRRLIALC